MAIEGIRYPADLQIEKDTDYFKIEVLNYTKNPNIGLINNTTTSALKAESNILLPMPSNIQDANTVSWGEEKMNTITANVLGAASDIMGKIDYSKPEKAVASFGMVWENIKDTIKPDVAIDLFTKQLASEAVNVFGANVSVDQILARQNGTIFNPNLELLFNGVTLRDFRFSFKMTPRSEKERSNVIKIIRTFKKYMAAKKGGEKDSKNLYLSAPHVFKLSYMKGAKAHPFLHKFKDCALKSVSVNYTGENVYATYWDGTPISVIIDLNFQELTPIYQDEYKEPLEATDNYGVGY
jgi:hypothetical protein